MNAQSGKFFVFVMSFCYTILQCNLEHCSRKIPNFFYMTLKCARMKNKNVFSTIFFYYLLQHFAGTDNKIMVI